MSEPRTGSGRMYGLVALVVLAGGLAVGGVMFRTHPADPPKDQPPGTGPSVGGIPLFATWPKGKSPDAAVVVSGQTFGHLQPCGCSRPQQGGLERCANFISSLKAKGWPVAGIDLGDVYPARDPIGPSAIRPSVDQAREKYRTSMLALKEMGYLAVGVGKTEFDAGILHVLGEYAMQKEQPPFTFAGNLAGKVNGNRLPRDQFFPAVPPGTKPMVGMADVFTIGGVAVGVAAVTGPTLAKEAVKSDPLIDFDANPKILADVLAALNNNPNKPLVKFLMYQGTVDEAKTVAEEWPEYDVILCQADDPEPPQFPIMHGGKKHPAGKQTMVVQVGHKGRYVGTVGVFKTANGVDLKYQLIPLLEDYLTPPGPEAEKGHKVLGLLDEYAGQVKARKFLEKVQQVPHPAQIQQAKLNISYVGSDRCFGCHAAEATRWKEVPHSHALDTLANKAKRPGQRNFDPECAVCHTVGLGYKTGFEDEKKTPHLAHVGCESCHGPGSGHMSNPKSLELNALQSPWKQVKGDKLPDVATMEKLAKLNPVEQGQFELPIAQKRMVNVVSQMCMKCHDHDNDPHFDLYKYWPKVAHGPAVAAGAVKKP